MNGPYLVTFNILGKWKMIRSQREEGDQRYEQASDH